MRLSEQQKNKIQELCQSFNVRALYLFGSSARDDFKETSDYDFLVEFFRDSFEGAFEQYFGFREALELLLEKNVDLICYNAIRNPVLKEETEKTRVELYAA